MPPPGGRRVQALRHAWVVQALGETGGLPLKPGVKWVETIWTDPARLGVPSAPTGVDGPALVVEVRQLARRGPVKREQWVLPATLMPWRPGGVPWVDPHFVDQLYAFLIRVHFRAVLSKPIGHRWRRRRPTAAGWPVLTQHVIPRLYDYLRPYYAVRHYQPGLGPGYRNLAEKRSRVSPGPVSDHQKRNTGCGYPASDWRAVSWRLAQKERSVQ